MPLPGNFQTVTVTGTYLGIDGAVLSGTVKFMANATLVDASAAVVIVPKPLVVTLDGNGAFTTQLPATNDPDIAPLNFAYEVTETFDRAGTRHYFIQVPFDTVGSLDLSTIAPLQEVSTPTAGISHSQLTGVTSGQHHAESHDDSKHTAAGRLEFQDEGATVAVRSKLNFVGAGVTATDDSGNGRVNVNIPGGAPPGYGTVQDEGSNLPQQTVLDFVGAGVTAANDAGAGRTTVTIPGGAASGGYQTVQDEGSPAAQQATMNFMGAGVTVADDAINSRTNITIPSAAATTMPRPSLCVVYSNDFPAALKTSIATYDFTCDAISDEVQINAAITQAAITRGDVRLMGFLYKIRAPILMKTATHLLGLGMDVTRIEADTTGWAGSALLKLADVNVHATEVDHFWLDGKLQLSGGANVHGINYDNTGGSFTGSPSTSPDPSHTLHHLRVYSLTGKGVWPSGNCRGSEYHRIYVLGAGEEGWRIESPDSEYSDCQSGSSGLAGFYLAGANNRYSNLKAWYSDSHGFQIASSPRQSLVNCEAQDNLGSGFHITTGQQTLVGCQADSNSYDGSPSGAITGRSFYGFNFSGCTGLLCQACLAYDKNEGSRGARQLYGFFFTSGAVNNIVDGVTKGNYTGSVGGTVDPSTTTRIKSADGK